MSLIKIEKLSKIFYSGEEEIRALDRIDLEIGEGEFVALTGPSGSGKSTLLYILGLLDSPTSGSYYLNATLSDQLSDNERSCLRNQSIGFVFQNFQLLPRASALRNTSLPLLYSAGYQKRLSQTEINNRAKAALARVSLSDRLNHKPNELSGGQKQRVAIARAIVNHPSLLLADEPTGNLDSKNGQEILAIFQQLNREGVSILLVTHDPVIASYAKRKIKMFDGKIIEDRYGMD